MWQVCQESQVNTVPIRVCRCDSESVSHTNCHIECGHNLDARTVVSYKQTTSHHYLLECPLIVLQTRKFDSFQLS